DKKRFESIEIAEIDADFSDENNKEAETDEDLYEVEKILKHNYDETKGGTPFITVGSTREILMPDSYLMNIGVATAVRERPKEVHPREMMFNEMEELPSSSKRRRQSSSPGKNRSRSRQRTMIPKRPFPTCEDSDSDSDSYVVIPEEEDEDSLPPCLNEDLESPCMCMTSEDWERDVIDIWRIDCVNKRLMIFLEW
ncbi:12705_t:CDS:2, partial [Acaulospora colombiana]